MPDQRPDQQTTSWHFDKKVPITLIVMVALQLAGGIWYVAWRAARDEVQQERIERLERELTSSNTSGRVAVLEAQQAAMLDRLRAMDGKLDRLIERERR